MSAAWVVARNHARKNGLSLLLIVVLTTSSAAVALGALAGAARTSSALTRAFEVSRYPEGNMDVGKIDPALVQEVRHLPQVTEVGMGTYVAVRPAGTDLVGGIDVVGVLPVDDKAFYEIGLPRMLEGRMPNPNRSDEVALGPSLAARLGIEVGDEIGVEAYNQEQAFSVFSGTEPIEPAGLEFDATVVGIGVGLSEITNEVDDDFFGVIMLSPELFEEMGSPLVDSSKPFDSEVGFFRFFLQMSLAPGTDASEVTPSVFEIYDGVATTAFSEERDVLFGDARDAIAVQSIALGATALAAALAGLFAVGQGAARQVALATRPNDATLRAIGFTRRQRAVAAFLPAGVAIVVGCILGLCIAVVGSGLFPRGLAGRLEPEPGMRVDLRTLVPGVVSFAGLLLLRVAASAWYQSSIRREQLTLSTGFRTGSSSPSLSMGLRFATSAGRGPTRVPVRPAVLGAIVGIAGVVAAFTFATSLTELVTTPRLYGDGWDLHVPIQSGGRKVSERELPGLEDDPRIEAVARYRGIEAAIDDGDPILGSVIESYKGEIAPTFLEGRLPTRPGEIALSSELADELGVRVGDSLELSQEKRTETFDTVGIMTGTAFTPFLVGLDPDSALVSQGFHDVGFFINAADDVKIPDLARDLRETFAEVYRTTPPPSVKNLSDVRGVPFLVAAFLILLAVAAVGHLLVTAVRRRSRDLAILKVIGFSRAQLRTTVVIQAIFVAVLGVLGGTPLGIALGRGAWSIVVSSIGVVDAPSIPWSRLMLLVPTALALSALLALLPSQRAATTAPAAILRSE